MRARRRGISSVGIFVPKNEKRTSNEKQYDWFWNAHCGEKAYAGFVAKQFANESFDFIELELPLRNAEASIAAAVTLKFHYQMITSTPKKQIIDQ